MDPKDLRKQLEETVNPVIDERLEGKAPQRPAQEQAPAQESAPITPPAQAQTPAAVAPSAPAAGAQPEAPVQTPSKGRVDAVVAAAPLGADGKVEGGTGYATELALMEGIPVYLHDPKSGGWVYADAPQTSADGWTEIDSPPYDVKEIAGIGSRTLPQESVQAINDYVSGLKTDTVIHSGGATGADTLFERAHVAKGGKVIAHSFEGHSTSSQGKMVHSPQELTVAEAKMDKVIKALGRSKASKQYVRDLINRNTFQVLPGLATESATSPVSEMSSFGTTDPVDAERNPTLSTELAQRAPSPVSEQGGLPVPPQGETPVSVAPTAISEEITTTAEAMNAGLRTSTTRAAAWKVGDYLDFSQDGVKGFWRIKEVKKYDFNNPADIAAWESTEGWNFERIKQEGGALLTQLTKPNSRTFILEKVDSLPEGAKAIKQGMYYKYGPDGKTFDPSFTKLAGSVPEKITTAATPDLEARLAATRTGELRAAPSDEANKRAARMTQLEREQSILGYDPMADLMAERPYVSEKKFAAQRELLKSYKKYLEDAGLYTSGRMQAFVESLKSSELVFDEETNRYELKPSQALDRELRGAAKARAGSRAEFMAKPHGVERKVYDLYTKMILGMEARPGKKVAAQDSEADATAVNRGRRAMRRLGLHYLLNFIPAADEARWGELRTMFREILTESGLPEEVFDSANARSEPLYGAKDQRSFNNDANRIRGHIQNIRTVAGELLKRGELGKVATHPDVAQSLYYLLSEIVQADREILSGEMSSVNPFAEEEYVRSTSDDLSEFASEIEDLKSKKGIPAETGARQGIRDGAANYTLVDYKNYLRGGQRRYALDIAGVIDPRWVEVDSKGLDLPIFANPNHPDSASAGDGMTPSGSGSTKASIGFNVSTDPTSSIPNDSNLQRISTLEIRVNKALKEFLRDRDAIGLLRPGTDDKTIRVASDIPYTQDRFIVGKRVGELRGLLNTGKIVIVAFPQFDQKGGSITYPEGDVVSVDGRVFYRKPGEMVALSENDPAIAKLVTAGASTTKPFLLGQQVEYPAGQIKPGQFGSFIVDIDPVVHQAVQHKLPLRSVGGVPFQGAYIPEQFAGEFQGDTQVVSEQGLRKKQTGIVQEVVTPDGRKFVGATTEQPVRTLVVADDEGNFPVVGTMIDGYVYGDPYGEDPRMYTQVADRSGPTMRDAMEQVRAYEEAIASGAPRSEAIEPNPEMQTRIEAEVAPSPQTSMLPTAEAMYESAVERYNEYQQLKAKIAADPNNQELKQEIKNKFPNASEMRKPEAPNARRLEEIGTAKRVAEYYGSDVYERTDRAKTATAKGSEMRGTLTDLPPADRSPLTPDQRKAANSLLRSLIVVLRHRAAVSNFIGAGGLNSDTSVIAETSDTISRLFDHLDKGGLYNAYFDSIISKDVFAEGLGASNPDADFWLQRLQELPGQRPLSTRGRDTGRFIERTPLFRRELGAAKGELTVWDPLDNFTDAVDSLYEAVADFHAQNPVRMRPNTSLESVVSRAASTDDQPVEDEVTVQETISEGEQIDKAGGDAPLTDAEKKFATANGLEVKEHPGPVSVLRTMIKYDAEVRRIASQGKGKIRTSEVRGKLMRLRELLDKANKAVGTDKYVPGVGVFRSEEAKLRDLRKAHDPAMSSAIQEATRKVLLLPIEDRAKAVDLAFNKYSMHLADDMDGDALVKVINSMLYGDDAEDSLSALVDSQRNMDITESINAEEIPQLYGDEIARVITPDELLSLSGANRSEIRRLLEFTRNRGYDIIVARTPDRGNRIIMTKVSKDKFGKMTIAPDEDFTKRNLFTADEVNTALSNFGALDMIRVVDTGVMDGRTKLYEIQLNAGALELLGDVPDAGTPQNKQFVSSLRTLLDASLKAEFRRLVSEAAIREGSTVGFEAPQLDPVRVYSEMKMTGEYGPFGVRRDRNASGSRVFWAVRRGADSAERLAMLSEYAEKVKPGSDPVLDALRKKGNAPAFSPLDPETEGLSRRARSAIRNHRMGLVAGGGMLGAIAMGVGVDAAMNRAQYGEQAAADYLPTSVAMNAAFEASPLLGSALALTHSAVNKQDMARTLVNILGSLAGGAIGGAAGAFGGPVGAFAAGTAGSMAGAGITNAIYGAVTGQGDGNYQQMPANVAVDRGDSGGAASIAATGMSIERKKSSGLDELKKLQEMGG